jgi:bacterioferritin-associated ferredoxin
MECDGLSVPAGRRDAYVCVCMRITHADLLHAVAGDEVRTLADLRQQTGAGDGCMACHRRLRCYLAPRTAEAVCQEPSPDLLGQIVIEANLLD